MSRRKKIILAVTALVALFPLSIVVMHIRAKWRLESYKKELIAAGEKLTWEEVSPVRSEKIPKEADAAIQAVSQSGSVKFLAMPMKLISPGRARIAWKQPELRDEFQQSGVTNLWPFLSHWLKTNEGSLAILKETLRAPGEFLSGSDSAPIRTSRLRNAEYALAAAMIFSLHEKENELAFENLCACVALVKLYQNEASLHCQSLRKGCEETAFGATWEALQFDGWGEQRWAELQTLWETVDFLAEADFCLAIDRVQTLKSIEFEKEEHHGGFDGLSDVKRGAEDLVSEPQELFRRLKYDYPMFWMWKLVWSYGEQEACLRLWQEKIQKTRAAQMEAAPAEPNPFNSNRYGPKH